MIGRLSQFLGIGRRPIAGADFAYYESNDEVYTNSTTWVQAKRWTTPYMPAGKYLIGFYFRYAVWVVDAEEEYGFHRLQIDDTDTPFTNWVLEHTNNETWRRKSPLGFLATVDLTDGTHNIDFDIEVRASVYSMRVDTVRMFLMRLS